MMHLDSQTKKSLPIQSAAAPESTDRSSYCYWTFEGAEIAPSNEERSVARADKPSVQQNTRIAPIEIVPHLEERTMGLFSNLSLDRMEDLLLVELQDLYDAEQRLTNALPKMAHAAADIELQHAFTNHLRETERHVGRLEQAFEALGESPSRKTCDAMKGLIAEGDEIISADGKDSVRDAALIAAAQRVEHYEISAYGSARTFAQQVGQSRIVALLEQTLREEYATDEKLTEIAEASVNRAAAVR
jgi:ferritin-like metal-binding protein YciE